LFDLLVIGFRVLDYKANEQGKQTEVIIYGVLTLLFQPISIGWKLWNIVDVIVAIGLLINIYNLTKEKQKEQ
jgi:hypothetical protein